MSIQLQLQPLPPSCNLVLPNCLAFMYISQKIAVIGSAVLYHLVIVTTLFYPFLTGSLKNLEISIQNGGRLC